MMKGIHVSYSLVCEYMADEYLYVCVCMSSGVCIGVYVCMRACVHVFMYVCMYVCMNE